MRRKMVGVSWIYRLTKDELVREIVHRAVCSRRVTDLRQFLVKLARANPDLYEDQQLDAVDYDEEADRRADEARYGDELAIVSSAAEGTTPISTIDLDDQLWRMIFAPATDSAATTTTTTTPAPSAAAATTTTTTTKDDDDDQDEDDVPAELAERLGKLDYCRFDGTNLREFLASVEEARRQQQQQNGEAAVVTDDELLRGARVLLRGKRALSWLRGGRSFSTWQELVTELSEAFPEMTNGHVVGEAADADEHSREVNDKAAEESTSTSASVVVVAKKGRPRKRTVQQRNSNSSSSNNNARNSSGGSRAESSSTDDDKAVNNALLLEKSLMSAARRPVIVLKRLQQQQQNGTKSPTPTSSSPHGDNAEGESKVQLKSVPPATTTSSSSSSPSQPAADEDDDDNGISTADAQQQQPTTTIGGGRASRASAGKGQQQQQQTNQTEAKRRRVKKIVEPRKINASRRIAVNGTA